MQASQANRLPHVQQPSNVSHLNIIISQESSSTALGGQSKSIASRTWSTFSENAASDSDLSASRKEMEKKSIVMLAAQSELSPSEMRDLSTEGGVAAPNEPAREAILSAGPNNCNMVTAICRDGAEVAQKFSVMGGMAPYYSRADHSKNTMGGQRVPESCQAEETKAMSHQAK